MDWQPISTAPKDGQPIIVSNQDRGGVWVAKYSQRRAETLWSENPWFSLMLNTRWHANDYASMTPTVWMPLPPAPLSPEGNPHG